MPIGQDDLGEWPDHHHSPQSNNNNIKELELLQDSKKKFQIELDKLSYGLIKTEMVILDKFYLAEDYHQKYLHKNPNGYCGLKGTGAYYP